MVPNPEPGRPGNDCLRIDHRVRSQRRLLNVEGHRSALHQRCTRLVLDRSLQCVLTPVHVRESGPRAPGLQLRYWSAVQEQLYPVSRLQGWLQSYSDVQLARDVPQCLVLSWYLDSQ